MQNKVERPSINKLLESASTPISATEKYFAENLRVAIWRQRGQIGSLPSNQKMNVFMKKFAIVCGIDEMLATRITHKQEVKNVSRNIKTDALQIQLQGERYKESIITTQAPT